MLAGDKSDGESGAEGYLQILTDCLAEGYLLLDYAKANPIADDIELFGQAGIELDPTRVQYILDGIRSLAVDLNDRIGEAEAKNFQGWDGCSVFLLKFFFSSPSISRVVCLSSFIYFIHRTKVTYAQ